MDHFPKPINLRQPQSKENFLNFVRPRRRTKILTTILTVLISVFVVSGAVFAGTTIGQYISIGSGTPDLTLGDGDLYVTGTVEVDGDLAAKTGGAATFVVAAADASDRVKNQADYVADGTADDVEIQAAIDALPAAGGKVVLSEGLFNIAATINLRSGTSLQGMGAGDSLDPATDNGVTVLKATTAITVIEATDKNYFRIADLKIRGGSIGIFVQGTLGNGGSKSFILERLTINGITDGSPNHGIQLEGVSTDPVAGFFLDKIRIRRTTGMGLKIRHAWEFWASNIYSIATDNHAIQIRDSNAFQMTNIRGDWAGSPSGGRFNGMHLIGVEDATINNYAADNNNAEGLRIATVGNNISIVGGWMRDNGRDAALAANQRAGILVDSAVTNVKIIGVQSYNKTGTTQQYGIAGIGATHEVIGSTFVNNTIAPALSIAAGAIVRGNRGLVTESSGTSTIPSAATSTTVTHGLSVTPAAGDCTFVGSEDPTNSVGSMWIDTFTSTQMNLNVENDPGASNYDVAWTCQVL